MIKNTLPERWLIPMLLAIFVVSGFSGLIYQSIWTHYLKLFLGHAAYAQALVLGTFMGGLALGSWWAARLSSGARPLLVLYAIAEGLVGLYALIFHQTFVAVLEWMFDTALPGLESANGIFLLKWGVGLALILPPSILLGMTFPLMAEGVIQRAPARRGNLLAMLYAGNSLGAACGVLASGFVFVKLLGLPGTVQLAGLLNILVAILVIAAISLINPLGPPRETEEGKDTANSEPDRAGQPDKHFLLLMLAVAACTGLASFIYEVSWIRMLTMVLGSATSSFELMLASFILGLAIGGWWIRRRIDILASPLQALALIQLAMGLLAGATLLFYNQMFDLMSFLMLALDRTDQGYVVYKLGSFSLAMLVMLPATICAGMTLPLVTSVLARGGYGARATGHVYAVNTLGAIAGVALTTVLLLPWLGLRLTLLLAATIDVALAVVLILSPAAAASRRRVLGCAVAGLVGITAIGSLSSFDMLKMASSVYRSGVLLNADTSVIFHQDGRAATVAVRRSDDGNMSIATNGKTDAALSPGEDGHYGDEQTMKLLAALPMSMTPAATEIAVVGFGVGMTTHTLLGNANLQRVDTVEIEPAMVAGARLFGDKVARAFEDPRSEIRIEDAKTFFSSSHRRYDLIISEPSNPWVSGVAGLFSVEHYHQVKKYLKPQGVYAQWLQLYEFDIGLAFSVLKAFSAEFSDYALYVAANNDLVLVGVASGELPPITGELFAHAGLARELAQVGVENKADLEARLLIGKMQLEPLLQATSYPANSDYAPYVDQRAEKARFIGADTGEIENLNRLWLISNPAQQTRVIAEHTAGLSTELTSKFQDARFTMQLLRDDLNLAQWEGDFGVPLIPYEAAISVSRVLYRCNPGVAEAVWLADAVYLSDLTSVYGEPDLISLFWQAILDSGCFQQMPEPLQASMRFFMAVSERNDLEILRQGDLLMDYHFDVPNFWNYRVFHMLGAYSRLSQPAAGAEFVASLSAAAALELDSRVLAAAILAQARD